MQQKSHQAIAFFWSHCHKSGESSWNWDGNNLVERKQDTPLILTMLLLHQLRDVVCSLSSAPDVVKCLQCLLAVALSLLHP